ncbi:MAG: hypothetical protein R3Y04_01690 [Rikenellaceae bacterium]
MECVVDSNDEIEFLLEDCDYNIFWSVEQLEEYYRSRNRADSRS